MNAVQALLWLRSRQLPGRAKGRCSLRMKLLACSEQNISQTIHHHDD